MINPEIRQIGPSELKLLLQLNDYNDPDEMLSSNKDKLLKSDIGIYVAFCGTHPVGEIRVSYTSSDFNEAVRNVRAYVYALRVKPEVENKGIGSSLLSAVLKDLRLHGYQQATIGVEENNVKAKYMYTKAGFTEFLGKRSEKYQGDEFAYSLYLKQLCNR